jgi:V8-like Glu-specific endopeptidase/uncharacterized protein YycO
MPASIKPNRSEISRAFPVAGFSIRTGISPSWVEVAVATTPELLYGGPSVKPQRNPNNFWSSRVMGLLAAERGEVVFLLPPQVLTRFVGKERLYYGLATYRQNDYRSPEVTRLPMEAVPYLRISSTFSGNTRGLMGLGNSSGGLINSGNQYVNGGPASLEWGADTATAGEVVAVAAPTNGNGDKRQANGNGNGNGHKGNGASATNGGAAQQQPSAQGLRYDDGFDPKFWSRPQAAAQYETNYGMEAVAQATLQRQQGRRTAPARPFSQVKLAYEPADPQQALRLQAEFNQRRDQWSVGVSNTSFFPHSAICQLIIDYADGGRGRGTGFYIGPNRLLSCSHNFIHPLTGSLAAALTVIPGKNGDQSVAPAFTITSGWYTHPRYDRSFNFDLAVIDVPNSAPNDLYFTVLEALSESRESPIIVCGYLHGGVNGEIQHLDGDAIREISENGEIYYYNLQTEPRASGSPVYQVWGYEDPEQQMSVSEIHIVGVHVGGEDSPDHPDMNRACRLTESKIAWINNPNAPASFGLGSRALSNGRNGSNTLPVVHRPSAATLSSDIPLDPGSVGGRSIGLDALQPGDIIVSTTSQIPSWLIRHVTDAPVSHSMLYVDHGGQVIEAIGPGIVMRPLAEALADASLAVAFRYPNLSEEQALMIADFAAQQLDKPFNWEGMVVRHPRFKIKSSNCDGLEGEAYEACLNNHRQVWLGSGDNDTFFCSELVVAAYQNAGVPLTSTPPIWTTPGDLAELRLTTLEYIGASVNVTDVDELQRPLNEWQQSKRTHPPHAAKWQWAAQWCFTVFTTPLGSVSIRPCFQRRIIRCELDRYSTYPAINEYVLLGGLGGNDYRLARSYISESR